MLRLTAIVCVFALAVIPFTGGVAARTLCFLGLLIASYEAFRIDRRQVLLSPLFLIATQAVVFYSIVPSLVVFLPDSVKSPGMVIWPRTALGGAAEALILTFSMVLLMLLCVLPLWCRKPVASELSKGLRFGAGAFLAVGIGVSVLHYVGRLEFVSNNIINLLQPILSTLIVILAVEAGRHRRLIWAVVVSVLPVSVLMSVGIAKVPLYLLVGLAWMMLLSRAADGRRLISLTLAVALGLVALTSINLARGKLDIGNGINGVARTMLQSLSGKLFDRQLESMYCLENVVNRDWDKGWHNPVYFLQALIPRQLWTEKPSLSIGDQIWRNYCAFDVDAVVPSHSGSITLIGEPIMYGGGFGFFVAVIALLVLLMAISLFMVRHPKSGQIFIFSMLPWIVDFDQIFAIYWANIFKLGFISMCTLNTVSFLQNIKMVNKHG